LSDPRIAASWIVAPHTAAKLAILRSYLSAWFAILGRGTNFDRIIYIDGFAGPGRYRGGEDGSPIVALKAALGAQSAGLSLPFEFHFVERKRRAVNALKANIAELRAERQILSTTEIFIHERITFEEAYVKAIRPRLAAHARAPAFALVDPFGWTGIPMEILAELMKRRSTEILVNFMFEEINRFLNHPQQGKNFDDPFSCDEWRHGYQLSGDARKKFIHDLYRDQLRKAANARYVRSFEMRNESDASDYFLYFASNNLLGLIKMKEAMWKVDPGGGVSFTDATNFDQTVLFQPEFDCGQLRKLIADRFTGKRARVGDVENFVVEDTPFNAHHYKRVLIEMEGSGGFVPITPPPRRRKGTFPDPALVLEFRTVS
jgi:three-Cys-motif partner protein